MPMAEVRYEREDETVVAIITGEVDMSNATSVRQEIAASVTPDDDAVIIDMSELSFIDSAGLHAMIELGTVLEERRQQLLLCLPPKSTIRRAIEIIGLPHAVAVYSERSEAMDAVRASATESRPIGPGPTENA